MTTEERILKEGLREFLDKGFKDASLRGIVKAAGVTTGAFYGLFQDKQALFRALVCPSAEGLRRLFLKAQSDFLELTDREKMDEMHIYTRGRLIEFLDCIYENFTAFKLILSRSEGTEFSGFAESLVEVETESTYRYIDFVNKRENRNISLNHDLIHILNCAFFSAIFETVIHDMTREEAGEHVEKLWQFFSAGWDRLFSL